MGEPRPAGRGSKEITQGAALGDTEEEERDAPCPQGARERTHQGRCPRKGGKGRRVLEPGRRRRDRNPVRKGTRDAALPGRDSRPRRGPQGAPRRLGGDRAGGTPRSAVWDRGSGSRRTVHRAVQGRRVRSRELRGCGASPPSEAQGEGGAQTRSRARRCLGPREGAPAPARPHQMKSVQWLQKVGCLKKRAVNLWFFTSCTFFCRRAPCGRSARCSPRPARRAPAAGSAICAREPEPEKCRSGPRDRGLRAREARKEWLPLRRLAAGASSAPALAAAARGAGAVTRPAAAARPVALGTAAGPSCGEGAEPRADPASLHLHRLQAPPSAASCFAY